MEHELKRSSNSNEHMDIIHASKATKAPTRTKAFALNQLTTLASRLLPIVADTHQDQDQDQHKRNKMILEQQQYHDIESGNVDTDDDGALLDMLEEEAQALMFAMNRVMYEDASPTAAVNVSSEEDDDSCCYYGDEEIQSEMHRLTSVVDSLTLEMAEVDAGLGGDTGNDYEPDVNISNTYGNDGSEATLKIRKDILRFIRLQLQPRAITAALYWSVAMLWAFFLLAGKNRFSLQDDDSVMDFLERTLGIDQISLSPP